MIGSHALPAVLVRPRTHDQLHEWFRGFVGFNIPRHAACTDRGHVAPFEFTAKAFFNEFDSGANVGPRGGGKTRGVSLLHHANGVHKPKLWTSHVGAVEAQALRCRDYMDGYRREWPWRRLYKRNKVGRQFELWNAAKWEPLTSTMNQLSGPRPQVACFDELEWWAWERYQQGINMISSLRTEIDGPRGKRIVEYPGQLILISTRQSTYGTMARVVRNAERSKIYVAIYCVYEIMQKCPVAGPGCPLFDAKDPETGLPRCQLLDQGELKFRCQHGQGHKAYRDVIRDFRNSDLEVWATQHECARPSRHGLVYANWDGERVHIDDKKAAYRRGWPVFLGGDWGWTHPTVIGFYQTDGETVWRFDEVAATETQIETVIDRVEAKLQEYGIQRLDTMWAGRDRPENLEKFRARFKKYGLRVNPVDQSLGIETENDGWRGGILEGIAENRRLLRDASGQVHFYVHSRCTLFIAQVDLYHYIELGPGPDEQMLYSEQPAKEDDDAMDEWRYVTSGLKLRRRRRRGGDDEGGEVKVVRPSGIAQETEITTPAGITVKRF